ncbi:hypothetical protein BOTBODRAFT_221042 [Botryobasidium botryosum FD-172 SS1]|uniref:Uncharacterized protein n=1 Tax=Botryobasidium botryosum (strain FD-172 SS1) TaxID=930990 RepID=A0A067MYI8_BOTB1|nr:hypothetical protein BOTBODRAFT_221042 [Botryobasidium botryosum FD-172 SS1]
MVILDKLPYAAGASWSPESGCLLDTRKALIEEIMDWIRGASASGGAEILCLTGVAGSGKTAIAHTVAQRCYEEGILASSFFFNREFEERNRPDKLLSTMARDLARHPDICNHLSSVLEADQSLATASLSRQFTPLVAEPCRRHTFDKSTIFRDDYPKLPRAFRLFATSRDIPHIDIYLSRCAHIRLRTIDLDAGVNLDDLSTYIHWRFGEMAEKLGLGPNWPDPGLENSFISRSQGLFQWAMAVFQALERAYDPAAVLEVLLAGSHMGLSPEEKMDEIYSKILQAYEWNDLGFKRDYDLIMGAILAAKSPLSASALQALHPRVLNVSRLLSRLGALLTGWKHPSQPVRILHLSLRDFLTARAPSSVPFYIREKDHSRRLGVLCLAYLNDNLNPNTPGVGYLESGSPGIPAVSKNQISEELWYACEFWTTHVLESEAPSPAEIVKLLRDFLSIRLISWMEVCASVGTFKGFQRIRTWTQSAFAEDIVSMSDELYRRLGNALVNISYRLFYMDRREEALLAIQEAVELYRHLAEGKPISSNDNNILASCINSLARCLSALGQREDALAVIREAVGLRRQLTQDRPAKFIPDLATSLNDLSAYLSNLGQREEALAAIREAVDLRRPLAHDRPAKFIPDLATSLKNLAHCLSSLGQREEALAAIREAVDLRRQLAHDLPATFDPKLASALSDLSTSLSDLGQREDALAATREAVDLRRQLALDRPVTFNPDLASSLNNLSMDLSDLGQREDALAAIREAVGLRRQLAQDRPVVFNPGLAMSLRNLSLCLSDLDHRGEALAAAKESVELYRPLAKKLPAVFKSEFVKSLRCLSRSLRKLGQEEGAVAAKEEADTLDIPEVLGA